MKANGLHYVEDWITGEISYTFAKFGGPDLDDDHTREFSQKREKNAQLDDTWWSNQLHNYLYRAYVMGLDIPGGRQALAKFAATAVAFLMSSVRVYGPLPKPGVTSGYNLDDMKELY